jgi:restriction system protein
MADLTQKRLGELVRAIFGILDKSTEGLQIGQVIQQLEKQVVLTAYEQADYPSTPGKRRFDKIIRFGTIAHVKAGWLIKSRGTWTLTEEGRKAYKKFSDPEAFSYEAGRLYRQWETGREASANVDYEDIEGVEDQNTSNLEEAEETAWSEIQTFLERMPPYDFQNLVAALLRAMGYHISWIAPPGRDGGIDIVAHTDPLGTQNPRIKVQVKRRSDKVSVDGLRSFLAVLSDQDVGLFVSMGGFTTDATNEARTQEKRKITLLDLQRLFDLWVEHYSKLSESEKQLLPLRPIYYLAPEA